LSNRKINERVHDHGFSVPKVFAIVRTWITSFATAGIPQGERKFNKTITKPLKKILESEGMDLASLGIEINLEQRNNGAYYVCNGNHPRGMENPVVATEIAIIMLNQILIDLPNTYRPLAMESTKAYSEREEIFPWLIDLIRKVFGASAINVDQQLAHLSRRLIEPLDPQSMHRQCLLPVNLIREIHLGFRVPVYLSRLGRFLLEHCEADDLPKMVVLAQTLAGPVERATELTDDIMRHMASVSQYLEHGTPYVGEREVEVTRLALHLLNMWFLSDPCWQAMRRSLNLNLHDKTITCASDFEETVLSWFGNLLRTTVGSGLPPGNNPIADGRLKGFWVVVGKFMFVLETRSEEARQNFFRTYFNID
jgi:hypothetical protein